MGQLSISDLEEIENVNVEQVWDSDYREVTSQLMPRTFGVNMGDCPQSGTSSDTDDIVNTTEQSKVELGQRSGNWNVMRDLGHAVSIGSVIVGDNKPSGRDYVEPSMNNIHPGIEDFNTTCDYYTNNFHLSGRCGE